MHSLIISDSFEEVVIQTEYIAYHKIANSFSIRRGKVIKSWCQYGYNYQNNILFVIIDITFLYLII